ncbi:hydroxyisourate hydrolase [Nocardioidaceae bacterium]|nr:hydroxyisourate hydrolase [Nocardioidaceae bacterium]
MSTLSTHVLDTATGTPAAGMTVTLRDDAGSVVADAVTDDDGRARFDGDHTGTVVLRFATGAWSASREASTFYPYVDVAVALAADRPHHHVPLLLSPFGYSTYRGS